MTLDIGTRVRTVIEVLADDGYLIPVGSLGMVVGHQGEKLVVAFDLEDATATLLPWEVLRARPVSA